MSTRYKFAAALAIASLLLSLTLVNLKTIHSSDPGGKIDLYTQNEPYSGKGPNMPSDAFSPQDVVVLCAAVTYNEMPVQNSLVAFNVILPSNTSFSISSRTNLDGVATINFTILTPPIAINESEVFGKWFALADVLIGDKVFQDTLTFNVDWIVKLISARTIDKDLNYRIYFGRTGYVGLVITLRNIAMVVKSATISVVIQDELNVPVSSLEIRDFMISPNGKLVFLYCSLYIPGWAFVGNATVYVSAFDTGVDGSRIPYCPEISTKFVILPSSPLTITYRDVAVVNVTPSTESVEVGQPVDIAVLVQNEGMENEVFDVTAYYDSILIGTLPVALTSHSYLTLNFTFDTSTVNPGNYTITVSVSSVVNEADLTDNVFIDGSVEVKPKLPIIFHDISIFNVTISSNTLYIGDLLEINVSIANKGTETETLDVGVYYDGLLIETSSVYDFQPNSTMTLVIVWNTSFVNEGFYEISASAPLPEDINILDNTFFDGVVQVKAPVQKRYYLSVVTDPFQIVHIAGEGWYNEGTNVALTAPQHVPITSDTRYSFILWNVDGTPTINLSTTILMDANHTATAHYALQYYLTINSPYGTPTGAGWYDAGLTTYAALDTDVLDHGNGTRRIFTSWSGDASGTHYAQSSPIIMDSPKTVTANWKTQFYLTIRTFPSGITTISGEDWYGESTDVTITAPTVSGYSFRFWDINGFLLEGPVSITIHMDAPKTVIAHYTRVTMYTLRIVADPGGTTVPTPGTYSYTANSIVQIQAIPNANYIFSRWELDGVDVGSTNPRTVLMDGNHTLRAVFSLAPAAWFVPLDWFYGLLLLALGLVIILLILWFYVRRRRRSAEEACHSGWTAWYYFYDLRSGN